MITAADYALIVNALGRQAAEDIAWAESLEPPTNADEMAREIIFVICNSGMKNTVARGIYKRCMSLLSGGERVQGNILGKSGKAPAIDSIWDQRGRIFSDYGALTTDAARLEFLGSIRWIGKITRFHLAKNFGAQVAKPDVHLQRLADREGVTAQALCERLAAIVGHKVATVDTILWRACATGILNSKTGEIRE